jgi:ribosome modulation factor
MFEQSLFEFYKAGEKAFTDGKEFWECPYVQVTDVTSYFPVWLAGWCFAKQQSQLNKNTNS